MSEELAKLSSDLEAQTAAFLRSGGAITKLDYAGVPIEAEYGQQVFLDPGQVAAPAPAKPAYGRLYQEPEPLPAPAAQAPLPKALPVIEPEPAPAVVAAADPKTSPAPTRPTIITELRAIRADARAWLARLDRSFPSKT